MKGLTDLENRKYSDENQLPTAGFVTSGERD